MLRLPSLRHRNRTLYAPILSGLGLLLAQLSASCGAGAEGVDDCRSIESARCTAAVHCPDSGVDDARACKRFYHDQCLHGLAVKSPGPVVVEACVADIQRAQACAEDATSCDSGTDPDSACAGILSPETLAGCAFLRADAGSGGATSSGGSVSTGGSASATGGASE